MIKLLRTKTFWVGIALVGYGITQIVAGNTQEGIKAVLEGLAVIFLRDALLKR